MATIYCFTSTGNSLYTAKAIADRIGADVLPMKKQPTVCNDDVIGFIFPCYFWGLPRQVERFLTNIEITNKNPYIFAVYTCGGSVFGVFGMLKRVLKLKNIQLQFGARIISVTNYLPEYKTKDSEARRQKIDTQIHQISESIIVREKKPIPMFSLLNRVIYKAFPNQNSDRYFNISDQCKGCATCQKVCPVDNIIMKSGTPSFQHKCEHCLGCLHNCPLGAIDWKNKTKGKERYRNVNVSLDDLINFNSCF